MSLGKKFLWEVCRDCHESHSWLIDPAGVKDIPAEGTARREEEGNSLGNANFGPLLE